MGARPPWPPRWGSSTSISTGALVPRGRCFYDELHFTLEGAEIVGQTVAKALLTPSGARKGSLRPTKRTASVSPPAG